MDLARVRWWKRKERGVWRKNIRINQILSVGPSDEAVGSRCLSSFKTKIPNIVLSLEHVHVRPRCTVYVCVRVRVVFESERE